MKKSVIKIEEINEIENRKNIKEINTKKSWLYEKMNKIENFLEKKKENTNYQYINFKRGYHYKPHRYYNDSKGTL